MSEARGPGTAPPGSIRSQKSLGHYPSNELASVAVFLAVVTGVFGAAAILLLAGDALDFVPPSIRIGVLAAAGAGALCVAYGMLVEPYRLTRRFVKIRSPRIRSPLRLVFLADTHVYVNHVEGLREQLSREPLDLPTIRTEPFSSIFDWQHEHSRVEGYHHHPRIRFEVAV